MENGQQPAHPTLVQSSSDSDFWSTINGLTKREIFAAMAMQGLIAANYSDSEGNARNAVYHADALLKALETKTE